MESTLSAPDGARVKKIFIRVNPPLSVAKEKKTIFSHG
jgi:hypothetical protein